MSKKIIFNGDCVVYKGIQYTWRNEHWYSCQNNMKVPLSLWHDLSERFKPVTEKKCPEKKRPKGQSQSSRKKFLIASGGIPGLGRKH